MWIKQLIFWMCGLIFLEPFPKSIQLQSWLLSYYDTNPHKLLFYQSFLTMTDNTWLT